MAVPTRIELAIFCVTGRRDNRYTTGPIGCGSWIWTNDLWVMSPTSYQAAPFRDINKNGGERGIRTPAPFPTCRFSRPDPSTRLGYFSKKRWCLKPDLNRHGIWLPQDFKSCASTNFAIQARVSNHSQAVSSNHLTRPQMTTKLYNTFYVFAILFYQKIIKVIKLNQKYDISIINYITFYEKKTILIKQSTWSL